MFNRKITNNPIARRSQQWICQALSDLMLEKPYNKITITEICNKADLVRETFYRNFQSKDAVIKYCLDEKFNEFADKIRDNDVELNIYNIGFYYFKFWEKEKEFLKLLIDNKLINLIMDNFSEQFEVISEKVIKKEETEQAKQYIIALYAGASTNLLIKWILNNCKEPPEEMARIMNEYGPNIQKC